MGDPPKLRNKYSRPKHLWEADRLKEDSAFKKDYGLKNMRELWMATAELKKYRREARRLLSLTEEERAKDKVKILTKLNKLGILNKDAEVDDVLSLTIKDVLERRLSTIVFRKGLANTISQSRQLITHGFIAVGGKKISAPSYLVDADEESLIAYSKPIDLNKKPPVVLDATKEETKTEKEIVKKEDNAVESKVEEN